MTGIVDVDGADAPPILLLHGGGANRRMWRPVITHLGDRRTIAIDLPGHGSRMDERFDMAEAVAAVDPFLADRPVVCGLSLGGYVAILAAARRPDAVRGLVLSGASASYRGWGGVSTRLYGYVVPLFGRFLFRKNEQALASIAGAEVAADMIEAGLSLRAAGQALRTVPGADYHGMVAAYHGPTMLLNGERDSVNRVDELALAGARPGIEVVTIADAGHGCALSQPAAFAKELDRFVVTVR